MATKENSAVLEVLNNHLNSAKEGCVVGKWIDDLDAETQTAFSLIKEKNLLVSLTAMYQDLDETQDLPFGLTSFRTHFRGSCTCLKTY
jgi:hypothetical protein